MAKIPPHPMQIRIEEIYRTKSNDEIYSAPVDRCCCRVERRTLILQQCSRFQKDNPGSSTIIYIKVKLLDS